MKTPFPAAALAALAALLVATVATPLTAQKKGDLLPASATGASAASGDVITQMSGDDVQRLLRDMGFSPQPLEGRDNAWAIEVSGRRALVMLSQSRQNIGLWSYVRGEGRVTMDKVNEWNKTKRFSRAYLDSDGDPNVEWDIDLEGGVSMGAVREGIRTFGIVVEAFKSYF
jgi:hypothetical protein